MLITEILSSTVPCEVVEENDEHFVTKAKIGGRWIYFATECLSKKQKHWEAAFSQQVGKDDFDFGLTGSGNELEVFSMVKDSMLAFIKKYEPWTIDFIADKDGGKKKNARGNVYEKLVNRFKIPGYKMERKSGASKDYFTLTKVE